MQHQKDLFGESGSVSGGFEKEDLNRIPLNMRMSADIGIQHSFPSYGLFAVLTDAEQEVG
jgi:hypothetical protein